MPKKILIGLFTSVAVVLFIEAVARVVWTIDSDLQQRKQRPPEAEALAITYSPDLGWERRPGYRGSVGGGEREFDHAGYLTVDSAQAFDAGKRKVVFIGGSNTFGFGARTDESFVEVIERLIPNVNTINLGFMGYSSYQGRVTLEKYLPILKPDMVVADFNYNDRRYILPPDHPDDEAQFKKLYKASIIRQASIAQSAEVSYAFRAFRSAMRSAGLAPQPVTQTQSARVDTLKPRVDENAFRRNLTWMAQETKRRSVPLLFVLMKDNPIPTEPLRKGIDSLRRGDYDGAIAYLKYAVWSNYTIAPLGRLYLAKAYEAKSDLKAAAEAIVSPVYRGYYKNLAIRLDTDYSDIMKQVARDEGVDLVDAAKVLDEHPYDYIDLNHLTADGHRRVAESVAPRIRQILRISHNGASQH